MSDEREERLRRLEALRSLGVDPFGKRFDGAESCGSVVARFAELENRGVVVAGRLTALRSFGKAAFLDLRDWTGKIQVHARREKLGEAWALFENLHVGDLAAFGGTLGKTRTGEITVFADRLTLLAKALRPLPEKWHGLTDSEVRHRRRYLDLIANPGVLQKFLKRTRILSLLRRFLDDRGYVEVETPMMQPIPGGAAARPFATHHNALDRDLFLRIALEIPLKKLLVGGMERVYEIGRVFRNEGVDSQHNPEFTLLELYHAYGDLRTMMDLAEGAVSFLAREVCGGLKVPFGGRSLNLEPPWPRREFGDLLRERAGVEAGDPEACRRRLVERRPDAAGMSPLEVLDGLFGEYVQPHLQDACFVTGQPIGLTPLCRERPGQAGVADRFELYIGGFEVANAYTELNDPIEQRRRLLDQAGGDEMAREGRIDEDFLEALEFGMPPAGGIGIGIDRLVMILTDNPSVREVILFPLLREAGT